MVLIYDSCEPIKSTQLSEFEKRLGITMPADYRQFLLKNNGGKVKPETFRYYHRIYEEIEETIIDRFLCVGRQGYFTIENYLKSYKNRIAVNLLPIATDLAADVICLGLSRDNYGKVFVWDHNFETDAEVMPTEEDDNIYLVADTFTDFLAKLEDFDD